MKTRSATARDSRREVIRDKTKVSKKVTQKPKHRHNAPAPISRLPPETLIEIFSLLPSSSNDCDCVPHLELISVTHVCRQWREVALCCPYLWTHIDFTKLSLTGFPEILARAKMSPLHFEAKITPLRGERFDAFGRQLEAHISHTRHLTISGEFHTTLERRLVSSAPALVSLSLRKSNTYSFSPYIIPDSLLNGTAPKLMRLELRGCSIGWKSPLLKGLQTLKIRAPSVQEMPTLEDWLDALNEMYQLKTLILDNATPTLSIDNPNIPAPQRTVTLPSLTHFDITAPARDCALALAHLVLPVLVSLHVTAEPQNTDWPGDDHDVLLLIPYVARNAHGPQDAAPLQTIVLNGEYMHAEIVAWTVPDADLGVSNSATLVKESASARLVLTVTSEVEVEWLEGMETAIFDAVLCHLPLNAISTLSALNDTKLRKEAWLDHAPRLTNLNRVVLASSAVKAFGEMIEEDVPHHGLPRLPQLTKLLLFNISLSGVDTYRLLNMLVKRKEHGVPLEVLDARTCRGPERAFVLFSETVGNMQGPPNNNKSSDPAFFDWEGGVNPFDEKKERSKYCKIVDYFWHGSTDESDDSDDSDEFGGYGLSEDEDDEGEDEDEAEDEDDDEFDDDDDDLYF